jgi:CBS domain-containing protein
MVEVADILRTNFRAVDKRDELHLVTGYLRGEVDRVPIVCDDGRPYGILNERSLLNQRFDARARIESHVLALPPAKPDDSGRAALAAMAAHRVSILPVGDGKKAHGYVHAADLLQDARSDATAQSLLIPVPTLTLTSSVGEAVHRMHESGAPALPVADAEGKVAGLFRRREAFALIMDNRPFGKENRREDPPPRVDAVGGILDGTAPTATLPTTFGAFLSALQNDDAVIVTGPTGEPLGIVTLETLVASTGSAGPASHGLGRSPGTEPQGAAARFR